jgi:hypothetical protein
MFWLEFIVTYRGGGGWIRGGELEKVERERSYSKKIRRRGIEMN